MRPSRSPGMPRRWLCGSAAIAGTVLLAAAPAAASGGHHSSKPSCLSASKLSADVAASWSGPKSSPGLSPGQRLCTYTQASSGATFLITHEALDGAAMKTLGVDTYPGTHFAAVSVGGDKALKGGHPGTDILLVQVGSQVYEFLDNTRMATTRQLEMLAKQVVP